MSSFVSNGYTYNFPKLPPPGCEPCELFQEFHIWQENGMIVRVLWVSDSDSDCGKKWHVSWHNFTTGECEPTPQTTFDDFQSAFAFWRRIVKVRGVFNTNRVGKWWQLN